MPALNVQASIEIAAPASRIKDTLVDFETWPVWSPWLYMEPDANVTYRGDTSVPGHGYDWLGDKTGAGGMTLLKASDTRIDCDLKFLKPFKSQADITFTLEETASGKTQVAWHMNSSLPFFMFFMQGTMTGMIRSDFSRGLKLLKDYIEQGSIASSSKIMALVEVESLFYIGMQSTASMEDISDSMSSAFGSVFTGVQASSVSVAGSPFSLYNKMDIKRGQCIYTAALPVSGQAVVSSPLIAEIRPACTALKVVHTGAYRHLGNAWATLMSEARYRKLKALKKSPPFECYLNDPDTTAEADLITELYLPLRH